MGKTFFALAAVTAATVAAPASAANIIARGGNTAHGQYDQFNLAADRHYVTGTDQSNQHSGRSLPVRWNFVDYAGWPASIWSPDRQLSYGHQSEYDRSAI